MTTKQTTKKEITHNDIIGRKIKVSDFVAVVVYGKLSVAKVIKLTPKMVKIQILNASTNIWYNGEHNRYPDDMAILDNEFLTFYLIRSSV